MHKIPNEIIQAVRKFKSVIRPDLNVIKIILFGSYAKGTYKRHSDIDICVVALGVRNTFLASLKIAPRVLEADPRIEPVVFSLREFQTTPCFGLLKEIRENGIEL